MAVSIWPRRLPGGEPPADRDAHQTRQPNNHERQAARLWDTEDRNAAERANRVAGDAGQWEIDIAGERVE